MDNCYRGELSNKKERIEEIFLINKGDNTYFTYWHIRDKSYNLMKKYRNIKDKLVIKLCNSKKEVSENKVEMNTAFISLVIKNPEEDKYYLTIGYEDINDEYIPLANSNKINLKSKEQKTEQIIWVENRNKLDEKIRN